MAYIINESFEDKFIKTEVYFADSCDALDKFFAETKAFPGTTRKASWKTGTFIPSNIVPKSVKITKDGALYDWLTLRGGGTLVSADFKAGVEQVEPNTHQFFPVTVLDRKGEERPNRFFVFNVVGRIDSIIEEDSNLKAHGRGEIEAWGYERKMGPWRCAMNAKVIAGRACWIEHRYGGCRFVSDRLAVVLEKKKLCGFELSDHCDEVEN